MTTTLIITFILATILLVVATENWLKCRRLKSEVNNLLDRQKESEKEKDFLKDTLQQVTMKGGIGESSVLSLIGDIARIENNLRHMQDVSGRKQIIKAIDRIKITLQAEDYTIVPLLDTPYQEGMQVTAVFIPDKSLPLGSAVITSVQKPQVNRAGKMIQAACVTVGQND